MSTLILSQIHSLHLSVTKRNQTANRTGWREESGKQFAQRETGQTRRWLGSLFKFVQCTICFTSPFFQWPSSSSFFICSRAPSCLCGAALQPTPHAGGLLCPKTTIPTLIIPRQKKSQATWLFLSLLVFCPAWE